MTVTVTPTVEASTGPDDPPRVRLNVTVSAGETSTTVTRSNPDGTTVTVRTYDGNPAQIVSGSALLYDYEMPYGAAVSYSSVESPSTVSATVTVAEPSVWLVHPGVPALSMPIELRAGSLDEETYTVQQGVFWPMGRENPVVVTDGSRKGAASSLTVVIDTTAQLSAIKNLIQNAGTLLLNIPDALGLAFDSCYIAVGEVRVARLSDIGSAPQRNVTMPFNVVDMPIGGSQSERNLLDLLDYPSLNAVRAHYKTLNDVLAGP